MIKLVFANWKDFGAFMEDLGLWNVSGHFVFDSDGDNLVVYWHDNPTLPEEALINFPLWFD